MVKSRGEPCFQVEKRVSFIRAISPNPAWLTRFARILGYGAWRSLVSAPVWGTGGPEFESRRPD